MRMMCVIVVAFLCECRVKLMVVMMLTVVDCLR